MLERLSLHGLPKFVVWNNVMCCAFESIIDAIVNYVELMVPVDGNSLCIFVDASTTGVNGMLYVYRTSGNLCHSTPSSCCPENLVILQPKSKSWLVDTLEHCAYYLRGVEFIAFTDHKALIGPPV